MQSPDSFGRAVAKQMDTIRAQLQRETPVRQGFLKLVKDIAEYFIAIEKSGKKQ